MKYTWPSKGLELLWISFRNLLMHQQEDGGERNSCLLTNFDLGQLCTFTALKFIYIQLSVCLYIVKILVLTLFLVRQLFYCWLWRCCCSLCAASNCLLEKNSLGEVLNLKKPAISFKVQSNCTSYSKASVLQFKSMRYNGMEIRSLQGTEKCLSLGQQLMKTLYIFVKNKYFTSKMGRQ